MVTPSISLAGLRVAAITGRNIDPLGRDGGARRLRREARDAVRAMQAANRRLQRAVDSGDLAGFAIAADDFSVASTRYDDAARGWEDVAAGLMPYLRALPSKPTRAARVPATVIALSARVVAQRRRTVLEYRSSSRASGS